MTILIEKELNGYYYRAMFSTKNGKPSMQTSLLNRRGTYQRNLDFRYFDSKEEGNEKFKSLIADGYKVIDKW